MTKTTYSIRKRALLISILISLLVFIAMFFAAYRISYHETEEILDQRLQSMAEWIAENAPNPQQSHFDTSKTYHEEDVFIDITLNTKLNSPQNSILFKQQQQAGLYRQPQDQHQFIAYIIPLADRQIQVAQPLYVRRELAIELAGSMLIPYLIALPLLFILLYWGIDRAFAPIRQLQGEFSRRQYHDLSALSKEDYPQELSAIIAETNALFSRIEVAQHAQNEFIAHAAHELRSPLTAVNLQIKMLQKEVPDSKTAQQLMSSILRLQHLVQQLLDLAKQGETTQLDAEQVTLQALLLDVVQDLYPLIHKKKIDLSLEAPDEKIELLINRHALHLTLRNLLDNAVKYTPELGKVQISINPPSVVSARSMIELIIEDSGIGIAEHEYANIMQKFYRINNVGIGSGLGLSIVEKSLEKLNAKIQFEKSTTLNGLKVTLWIPLHS
ncbi:two-component system, OmpR family, sensor kinase [Acinetobacter marinus]|uniref:histidine kinase n=1 Tax=Acinetobacter marinus TaxID=281375 RepID=A0A1G6MKI8_9GAMM|nr:ATP-binding protein [Acinetobacter marinus]SDC55737.1 two-component system, OmpR family, sensor kinase [Acinetobacter marinus]